MSTSHINKDVLNFLEGLTGEKLSIANLIRTIRECEEVSQAEFARGLGITRQRLCDIEHGRSRISPKLAASLARQLGYSEAQFIRLALQDILDRDNLHYTVGLDDAA